MRRTLGAALLAGAVLAGCGESSDLPATGGADATEPAVTLVSGAAGGGTVTTRATLLGDAAAVRAYVGGFDDAFAQKVVEAVDREPVAADQVLAAAVVAIGCDVPPGARVVLGRQVLIRAERIVAPHLECLAPVTTVALAAVPAQGRE